MRTVGDQTGHSYKSPMMMNDVHDVSAMHSWQRPLALRRLAIKAQLEMSHEAFLSRGGSREQKIQEALVGGIFLSVFCQLASHSHMLGRMATINEEALDMEVMGSDGTIWPFEITAAYTPGYKIRQEYKNGNRPEIPYSAFVGEPIPAEWVAASILNKTEKIRGKGMRRHLLVYNNIYGGTTDLQRLPRILGKAQDEWDSIWLIAGVPDIGWVARIAKSAQSFGWKGEPPGIPAFWSYGIDQSGVSILG